MAWLHLNEESCLGIGRDLSDILIKDVRLKKNSVSVLIHRKKSTKFQ
jgi:hypothetical protein